MQLRSVLQIGVLGVLVMTLATGCPSVQPESALTWGLKASTNRLTQTTPAEWQAIVSKINELSPGANVALTDDEATAIVEFVQANDLDSIQEIAQLVADVNDDPSSAGGVVIPESVTELFGNGELETALDGFMSGF